MFVSFTDCSFCDMATASRTRDEHSGGFPIGHKDHDTSFLQGRPCRENGSGHDSRDDGGNVFVRFYGRSRRSVHARGRSDNFLGKLSNCGSFRVEERCRDSECTKTRVKPYMHEGVYIQPEIKDAILTLNLVPGDIVRNDEVISVEDGNKKREYRIWNPFTSKLAAAVLRGITNIYMKRGSRVLYIGAGSCTTVSHVSDIVGCEGFVYALETSSSSADLQYLANLRKNIKIIKGDPTQPSDYQHKLQGLVDVIFCDVVQSELQATVLAINTRYFLKYKGNFILSITVSGNDRTSIEAIIASKLLILIDEKLKALESLNLQPYVKDHYIMNGIYLKKREVNYRRFCSRLLE